MKFEEFAFRIDQQKVPENVEVFVYCAHNNYEIRDVVFENNRLVIKTGGTGSVDNLNPITYKESA